jgi:hypothetical protein
MHTSRIENWTGHTMHVEPAVLIPVLSPISLPDDSPLRRSWWFNLVWPLLRGVSLPVWTIFLVIYPPLSCFFLAIAYLAFRWRWWKATDSP